MNATSEKMSKAQIVASIFWNFKEHRLRTIWRILSVSVSTAILMFVLGAPFFAKSPQGPAPYIEKIVLYVAAVVSILLVTRFLDRRQFSDTGILLKRDWWIDLGFGLLLGALVMTFIFLGELMAGWITIVETFYSADSNQVFMLSFLQPVLLALIVGFAEELMFRGYLLLNLAEGFNLRMIGPRRALILSWLLTSALFGVAHLISPNATAVSTINIALIGIWLGLGYVLTGSIAIPIGVHITWNLFQGYVFGFPVSGGRDFSTAVFVIKQGGPVFLTGGAFGPEAGFIGILASLLGFLLTVAWIRFRYHRQTLNTSIAEPPYDLQMS